MRLIAFRYGSFCSLDIEISMDLRQLRYFVVVATQQNFGRAADVLHVAQPALTRQIHLLEQELGIQLLERHARGASLTEAGAFLLERAQFLLRYTDQLKSDIGALQTEPIGTVAIGLSPGIAPLLAVPLTLRTKNRYPHMTLRFVEGLAPSLQQMVLSGEVDMAVLNGAVGARDLVMVPLLTEQMCLIGKPGDLNASRKEMAITELSDIPLVLTGLAKSGVRLQLEATAARAGVTLNTVVEVESLEVAKRLIFAGIGSTVHFAAVVQADIQAGRLAVIPIEGLYLERVVARASSRPASRATECLMAMLHEVVSEEVTSGRWPYGRLG
jgi:LysR family nitrogen assimilation transcriptional regulator